MIFIQISNLFAAKAIEECNLTQISDQCIRRMRCRPKKAGGRFGSPTWKFSKKFWILLLMQTQNNIYLYLGHIFYAQPWIQAKSSLVDWTWNLQRMIFLMGANIEMLRCQIFGLRKRSIWIISTEIQLKQTEKKEKVWNLIWGKEGEKRSKNEK